VHQRIQRGQGGRIRQHSGPQRGAIERAVGLQHLRAEPLGDGGEHGGAGSLGFPRQLVGVDDRGAPVTKEIDHGRFARGDVTG
jgi:hypothetical protein